MKKFLLGMIVLGISAPLFAGDIVWVRFGPKFSYVDSNTACKTHGLILDELFLATELDDDGNVVKATLRKSPDDLVHNPKIEFKDEELGFITFGTAKDETWVKEIKLNARLLNWIFFRTGSLFVGCRPPEPLKTLEPMEATYTFNLQDVEDSEDPADLVEIKSNKLRFKGVNQKDSQYQIRMLIEQGQFL